MYPNYRRLRRQLPAPERLLAETAENATSQQPPTSYPTRTQQASRVNTLRVNTALSDDGASMYGGARVGTLERDAPTGRRKPQAAFRPRELCRRNLGSFCQLP